ncbi:MAG: hypothetical protein ED559_02375 [Phycisphaera sp.]|nr:MAG: hypothetical protein ED559_02375 [Phycisphaera sp.]
MIGRTTLTAACALGLVVTGGCSWGWYGAKERATYTLPVAAGTIDSVESVVIRTRAGDVLLEPAEGEPKVIGKVRARTRERADATKVSADIVGDTLEITVNWPGGKRKDSEGCDLLVYVPAMNGVTIDTTAGDIFVKGMAGPLTIDSSAGDIEVHGHDGDVAVHTTAGDIRFWDITGTADVRSTAGDIALHGVAAPSYVRTTAGDVYIKFHEGTSATVEASTSAGDISFNGIEIRGNQGTGTIGDGAETTSRVRTSAGDISVTDSAG